MYKEDLKKRKNLILPMLGILLVSMAAVLFFFYETTGREMWFFQKVYVLNDDVHKGTKIEENMLTQIEVKKDTLLVNGIREKKEIVGLEAKHFIPKNVQLDKRFFEESGLITNQNNLIFKIPKEWIYSVPNSLRRKDKIYVYEVSAEMTLKLKGEMNQNIQKSEDGVNVKETVEAELSINSNKEEPIDVTSEEERRIFKEKINEKPLLITKVAYVKDSANREVVSTSKEERIDGTSTIADVEVVIDPGIDKHLLERAIKRGSKLIIMYAEGEENNEDRVTQ